MTPSAMTAARDARTSLRRRIERSRSRLGDVLVGRRAGASGYALADVVFVCGSPRSGTTWLGEIAAGALRAPLIFEPDHPRYWRRADMVSLGTDPASLATYGRLVTGRDLPRGVVRGRLLAAATSHRLVVKSIHGLRALDVLQAELALPTVVTIVRHPCAVVASRRAVGAFDPGSRERIVRHWGVDDGTVDRLSRLARSEVGDHAIAWALDHAVLHAGEPVPWTTIRYESLATEDDVTVTALARALDVGPDRVRSRLRTPSAVSWGRQRFDDVDAWRTTLTEGEIDEVLSVVDAAGLTWLLDTLPARAADAAAQRNPAGGS